MNSLTYYESRLDKRCQVTGDGVGDRHHICTVGMGGRHTQPMWEHFTVVNLKRFPVHVDVDNDMYKFEKRYGRNMDSLCHMALQNLVDAELITWKQILKWTAQRLYELNG